MDYKNSYFAEFTKEVTTIELDYTEFDRRGEDMYDEDDQPIQLIRASRYASTKWERAENYDTFINEIAQHTLNELTLQTNEVLIRIVKRLAQMDAHINDAWKIYFKQYELWRGGQFSSLDFEWKFFHFFNISVSRSAGMMEDPDFEKGKTTDDFFSDIHDAMMYKQGGVKWVLWHLREQLGIEHSKEEEDPKSSDLPSVDRSGKNPYNQHVYALIYNYIGNNVEKEQLEKEFDFTMTAKQKQLIRYYEIAPNRKGQGGGKGYRARIDDFKSVIKLLQAKGYSDAARNAEEEYLAYQNTCEKGEK